MPELIVVFNRLSSLNFETKSSGGDDLSLPIRSAPDRLFDQRSNQLSLVKPSRLAFLTRKAPASLPLCAQKIKKRKIFCTDDSASFVLGKRKTRNI